MAQIYVDDHYTSVVRPIMELKGFQRVELEAGETKTLHFTLGFDELRLLDASYHWVGGTGRLHSARGGECRGICR